VTPLPVLIGVTLWLGFLVTPRVSQPATAAATV